MAGAKEIRSKIASIKNTQKITKAMEMVAASKMRKAQDRMRAARPYAEKIRKLVGHLRQANPDYKHPFTLERPVQTVGIIVISTDRGLAGSLNINLFKVRAHGHPRGAGARQQGAPVRHRLQGACNSSGAWPASRSRRRSRTWATGRTIAELIGTIKVMLDLYRDAKSISCCWCTTCSSTP